jgi:hypothetical protein
VAVSEVVRLTPAPFIELRAKKIAKKKKECRKNDTLFLCFVVAAG